MGPKNDGALAGDSPALERSTFLKIILGLLALLYSFRIISRCVVRLKNNKELIDRTIGGTPEEMREKFLQTVQERIAERVWGLATRDSNKQNAQELQEEQGELASRLWDHEKNTINKNAFYKLQKRLASSHEDKYDLETTISILAEALTLHFNKLPTFADKRKKLEAVDIPDDAKLLRLVCDKLAALYSRELPTNKGNYKIISVCYDIEENNLSISEDLLGKIHINDELTREPILPPHPEATKQMRLVAAGNIIKTIRQNNIEELEGFIDKLGYSLFYQLLSEIEYFTKVRIEDLPIPCAWYLHGMHQAKDRTPSPWLDAMATSVYEKLISTQDLREQQQIIQKAALQENSKAVLEHTVNLMIIRAHFPIADIIAKELCKDNQEKKITDFYTKLLHNEIERSSKPGQEFCLQIMQYIKDPKVTKSALKCANEKNNLQFLVWHYATYGKHNEKQDSSLAKLRPAFNKFLEQQGCLTGDGEVRKFQGRIVIKLKEGTDSRANIFDSIIGAMDITSYADTTGYRYFIPHNSEFFQQQLLAHHGQKQAQSPSHTAKKKPANKPSPTSAPSTAPATISPADSADTTLSTASQNPVTENATIEATDALQTSTENPLPAAAGGAGASRPSTQTTLSEITALVFSQRNLAAILSDSTDDAAEVNLLQQTALTQLLALKSGIDNEVYATENWKQVCLPAFRFKLLRLCLASYHKETPDTNFKRLRNTLVHMTKPLPTGETHYLAAQKFLEAINSEMNTVPTKAELNGQMTSTLGAFFEGTGKRQDSKATRAAMRTDDAKALIDSALAGFKQCPLNLSSNLEEKASEAHMQPMYQPAANYHLIVFIEACLGLKENSLPLYEKIFSKLKDLEVDLEQLKAARNHMVHVKSKFDAADTEAKAYSLSHQDQTELNKLVNSATFIQSALDPIFEVIAHEVEPAPAC